MPREVAYRDAELLAGALHQALRGDRDERTALTHYQHQRDTALRDIFEVTLALAGYPPVAEFTALQKQLSAAIDAEATRAAERPMLGDHEFART